MHVPPESLSNRESEVALDEVSDDTTMRAGQDVRAELDALKARIVKAGTLEPKPHDLHCRDCFHRGRNAVLRFLQEG